MTDNIRKVFDILGVEPNERFKVEGYGNGIFYFSQELNLYFSKGLNLDDENSDWIDIGLQSFINGTNRIIKIPKKKKLRDITEQEIKKWKEKHCLATNYEYKCENCIFDNVCCSEKRGWWNHKELYSNEFLDQEIEV